jgi:predicted alpha/beta-fold hydrolase
MWGRLFRSPDTLPVRIERWDTPDDDFLELVRLDAETPSSPTLLLLHGLEGSQRSHYVSGVLGEAWRRGWQANLLLFRTCGDELNRQARSYHSGETSDLEFVVRRLLDTRPGAPVVLVGISLGGNVLLKWLGDPASFVSREVAAATAVSTPFDLARCSAHIDTGFSRLYSWNFLRGLKRKALAKIARIPGLADAERVRKARTLWDFDDAFTSVVHGFADAAEYYTRSSSIRFLQSIRVPTLLLSAVDDPFCPPGLLGEVRQLASTNPALRCEFVDQGGHVGFVEGASPWNVASYAERRPVEFADQVMGMSSPVAAR